MDDGAHAPRLSDIARTALRSTDLGNESYMMTLGPGFSWRLTGTPGTEAWLRKMATTMMLEPGAEDADARMTFVRGLSRKGWTFRRKNTVALLDAFPVEGVPRGEWGYWNSGSLKLWYQRGMGDVVCEIKNTKRGSREMLAMWHSIYAVHCRLAYLGGIPLHAALVERDGIGVLLVAGEGTGKSTCCRRIPHPWVARSDDGAVVVPVKTEAYMTHPFPTWSQVISGSSDQTWNVQNGVPLGAIFFLEQADQDEVIPVGQGTAAVMINESASYLCRLGWKKRGPVLDIPLMEKLFDNACRLARALPAFVLRATLTGCFWEEMERALPSSTVPGS